MPEIMWLFIGAALGVFVMCVLFMARDSEE